MREAQEDSRPEMTAAVRWLLAINVGVYFLQLTVFGDRNVFEALGFDSLAMPASWWGMATYMFVHGGLLHLAANMFALYTFGPRVERMWNARSFVFFYLWCGFGGALTHLILVRSGVLIGASAAVLGVMLAYAMWWPDDELLVFGVIPMKVKWFVAWMAAINLALGMTAQGGSSSVAALAHLGGLVFGWLYLKGPGSGGLERFRRRVAAVPDTNEDMPHVVPKQQARPRETRGSTDAVVAESTRVAEKPKLLPTAADVRKRRAEDVNHVLDKISSSGLDSLSPDERTILERFSRELRDR